MWKLSLLIAGFLPVFSQSSNMIVSVQNTAPIPVTVAPGEITTLYVAGLTGTTGVTAELHQSDVVIAMPVLDVRAVDACTPNCTAFTAVTVQIPYEIVEMIAGTARPQLEQTITVSQNGTTGASLPVNALPDQVHFVTQCDLPAGSGLKPNNTTALPCTPLVTHADGGLVSASNPAVLGETVVAYAYGLGRTNPAAETGKPATGPASVTGTFNVDYNFRPNALPTKPLPRDSSALLPAFPQPAYIGLTPGFSGLYQVNFLIPGIPAVPPCTDPAQAPAYANLTFTNLTISLGSSYSFDGVGICVGPFKPD